jgi:lipopolysaccharide export system ATP-binding protein
MDNGIVCLNLKKTVGQKKILDNVTIKASKGSIVALLGPNGAGKTTSFSILSGLIKPDSGHIFLNGKDITDLPMYKRARLGIGYLPQEASIFRGLNVEENINVVIEARNIKGKKRKELLENLLQDLSLEHVRKSPAVSISGGERRKLEIARAVAASPSFMLLDEPLAGVDPLAISDMREMIFSLKNRGIGVIITDHNVRDTLPIADYVYILHDGKVLIEGKPNDIVKNKTAKKMYLGESFSQNNHFFEE